MCYNPAAMNSMLFSPLNFVVLFAYLGGLILIGVRMAGRQRNTEDFFLAGRRMPWPIVAMSMYASLTSAVTFMGLPTTAYRQNISMIVVCVISPIVAPLLIWIFYPFYHRLRVTTSYEYVGRRFGMPARHAVSGLFLLARLGWVGTVIYAPAIALSVVTGIEQWQAILLMGAIATAYTTLGGMSADIWTDVLQFVIMIAGAVWIAHTLVAAVPGGIESILQAAREAGRLKVMDWRINVREMTGFAVAVAFFFQLMQDYGTDQTTVQRMMAIPSQRGVSLAIVFNAVVDFFIIGLLLFIGLGLLAFHQLNPELVPTGDATDSLLPHYIIHALPDGVSGLLITAIFAAAMSSMDSGISSLSTVVINDFVKPIRRKPGSERHDLRLARGLTLVFGVFGTLTAFYVASFKGIISGYMSIVSLFNGPILALFLLGMLTRRGRFAGWAAGTVLAFIVTLWLQYRVEAHWVYYFPASFGVSFIGGYLASLLMREKPPPAGLTMWDRGRGAVSDR